MAKHQFFKTKVDTGVCGCRREKHPEAMHIFELVAVGSLVNLFILLDYWLYAGRYG